MPSMSPRAVTRAVGLLHLHLPTGCLLHPSSTDWLSHLLRSCLVNASQAMYQEDQRLVGSWSLESLSSVRMRSLAECSEPSPYVSTGQEIVEVLEEPSRYPYNLRSLYPPVYPYFDLYPTEGPIVNPKKQAPVHKTQLGSAQLSYPYNLCALYPAVYPHFDLYPYERPLSALCSKTPRQIPQQREAQLEILAYPYSLNAIYPACYPFFDSYPSKETCQLAKIVTTVQRDDVTPLPPRKKLSASRLSPIFVDKSKLQDRVMDSPSERFDLSGSKNVADFKKKRGESLHLLRG